jgi:hypothetical protein
MGIRSKISIKKHLFFRGTGVAPLGVQFTYEGGEY